ncbi:Iron-binding zinc finger CDGSH type [compost metagenome]
MPDSKQSAPILPEVIHVHPGDRLRLCRCGFSPSGPDCPPDCDSGQPLEIHREQYLLLCRCGLSRTPPYCDGSHTPVAAGFRERLTRFLGR